MESNSIKKEHKMDLILDWIKVEGNSMRPFLKHGERIGVEWLHPEIPKKLRVGDIVVGKNRGDKSWVVHRIVSMKDGYHVKGDASHAWDDLDNNKIWGKVVGLRRRKKDKTLMLRSSKIDRLIARLSYHTIPARTPKARVSQRLIYLLGFIRKRLLRSPH